MALETAKECVACNLCVDVCPVEDCITMEELQPGMTLCVEALVGEDGGDFCIKLEDQVLVTEDGFDNLTVYPWDADLMGLS